MFESLEHLTYQSGDQIFQEGDKGDCAFLIESGSIDISTRKDSKFYRIIILGEGDLFGEIALIDNEPRTATATALEETRLIRIDR
ncbi:MAG: cyclic nucleotide-binding domain-containing protein, partial [Gammaproteobacteria bacterium]|nr:cyclic nucleotide-binding domain-containing protein [Gammaproteobacteria bacterium]